MQCPSCRDQMLDYLYDLLDDADRREVQAHLDGCAACRAQLEKARAQQNLLAAAARMEFPAVTFAAPAATESAPAVVPLPKPARKTRPWRRYAAAAAILLVIGGLAVPGWRAQQQYADAGRVAEEFKSKQETARRQMADAVAQITTVLPRQEAEKIEGVKNADRAAQLKMTVVGQETAVAGAPSKYEIQTTDLNGQLVAASVTYSVPGVVDGEARVPGVAGKYNLTLPPDLPVKPDSRLTLVVSARRDDIGAQAQVSGEFDLAPPVYIAHLETDKPMYQPGEMVHYRSLTLDRFSLRPAEEDLRLSYDLITPKGARRTLVEGAEGLRDLDGAEMLGPDKKPVRGVGAGEFVLDPNIEGGEYTLVCREQANRFPEQRRKFIVNNYPKPQLDKKLDFGRSTYGPGDEASAVCKASWAGRGPLSNQPVEATVLIDGKKYGADGKETTQPLRFQTDDKGEVVVRFKLPAAIERGEASLGVKFVTVPETIARPVPIVLKKLDVEFYPEGGDLAADLPNRVYFQVRTPLGKPADLTGRLLEDGKPLPIAVATVHDEKEPGVNQGMGRFEFTPKSGKTYALQIDSPAGIADPVALPKAIDDRVALSVPDGVADAGRPIRVAVRSKTERPLLIGLYCRGRLLQSVQLKKGETEAVLNPEAAAGGVCRVTAFEEKTTPDNRRELTPVAERLIYRRPAEQLTVRLSADQSSYVPGQHATLTVETQTEKGEPAPAVVMVGVVDKSVLTLADEKTYRSMPTHFLLTSEVRRPEDLEYADFLLGPQEKAKDALDLLLGVQGWRRFAEQDPAKFRQKDLDREEAERLLVMSGQSPHKTDFEQQEINKITQATNAQVAALKGQYEQASQDAASASGDPACTAAAATRESYDRVLEKVRAFGSPIVGAALFVAALAFLVVGLVKRWRRAVPWYAAAAAAAAACVAVVVVTVQAYHAAPNAPAGGDAQVAMAGNLAEPPIPDAMPAPAEEPQQDALAAGQGGPGGFGLANGALGAAPPAAPPQPALALAPPPVGQPLAPAAMAPGGGTGAANKPGASPTALTAATADDKVGLEKKADADVALRDAFREEGKNLLPKQAAALDEEQLRQEGLQKRKADGLGRDMDQADKGEARGAKDGKEADLDARRAAWDRNMQAFNRNRERERAPGAVANGFTAAAAPNMVVREYAHLRNEAADQGLRRDFAETICWRPVLVLPDGKAVVSFDLSDSVTTFQVIAYAHTLDGRLGAGVALLQSRLPVAVHAVTPIEVTASDVIGVPVTVSNNTSDKRDVQLTLNRHDGLQLLDGKESDRFSVDGGKMARPVYRFRPTAEEGEALLEFAGRADAFAADGERANFRIVPEGFPVSQSRSDLLEGSASQTVELPETWVKGTLKCRVQVYPSTLADLQSGLESLLREPGGCFEQTSTSNYPNVLILDYLKESNQANPELERHARDLLSRGYQKLTSFECQDAAKNAREGYEWFGGTAPPHEALTAYGLLEFRDMARVQDVDPAMLKRTQDYLLSRRDGKGGFLRNPRALDSFGRAPDDVTNAYIVWALTESGNDDDLTTELNALAGQAKTSKDPYFLSLVANSLINRARTDEAVTLLQTVAGAQKEDGHLDAEKTSITGSGGRDLQIETTALAVLGWLKANPGAFNANLQKAVKWIGQQRGGYGGFGSTQSTILALKALIAYTNANKRTAEGGELRLFVGDKEAAKLSFPAGASEALTLELKDAETVLRPGKNDVRVAVTGKNTFPYTLAWSYQTLKPVAAEDCPVRLRTALSETKVSEGDLLRLNVTLENVSGQGQGMAVAVLGLPGGLTVPEDMKQLKQYTRVPEDGSRPLVSAFEVRGRELVLYWRDLAPGQKIQVPLDLIARVPGEYSGPASRGYLYYNADHKDWVDPLRVTIAAKAE